MISDMATPWKRAHDVVMLQVWYTEGLKDCGQCLHLEVFWSNEGIERPKADNWLLTLGFFGARRKVEVNLLGAF